MKSFIAFLKKEILDSMRSGKFIVLGIMFLLFGVMNPAIAKLTPWLFELLSDSLEQEGIIMTTVEVNAITSWTQFFKNIPIALIVFVLVYSNSFTKEYESGTLVLVLTKGVSRFKVVIAKAVLMLSFWTVGYFACFVTTYTYNAFFWDNSIAVGLMTAAINWWLLGVLVICLVVLFSTLSRNQIGVLLGTGGIVMVSYLAGMFPKIGEFMPTFLMNARDIITGMESSDVYVKAIVSSAFMCVFCLAISIPVMNKKQI